MVREGAQLYTMEGVAAGLIMLLTTYLVLGSTSVYTPGDTHITDMQLEQVGSDILKIMDTPTNLTSGGIPSNSTLRTIVAGTDGASFNGRIPTTSPRCATASCASTPCTRTPSRS